MDEFRIPLSIEFVDSTPKELTEWAIWVPIIISLVSVFLAYRQARDTKKNNEDILTQQKKNNDAILKQQKELGEATIKAEVISKSRIDWIQEVRKAVANLIASYSDLAKSNPSNSDVYLQKLVDLQEKNEMLILYFGNDQSSELHDIFNGDKLIYVDEKECQFIITPEATEKLTDLKSNRGKNEFVVLYLRKLKEYFDLYYKHYSSKKREELIKLRFEAQDSMYHFEGQEFIEQEFDLDDGTVGLSSMPLHVNKEAAERVSYYDSKLEVYDIPKHIAECLPFLSEIMRAYLKIEWTKAKEGQ